MTNQAMSALEVPRFEGTQSSALELQWARESNARSYPRRLPLVLASGSGIYVKDPAGRSYIDCLAGAGALALGHHHPVVREALERAIRDGLPLQTLDLMTPAKEEFMQTLLSCLPERFSRKARIQFCGPSGADAVEAGVKLVKTATGRRSMLSFHGGYHGMTHGSLALTGCLSPKTAISGLMPEVHFLPFPYSYRSAFGQGDASHRVISSYIERLLDDPNSGVVAPAGMILEPVQGEGGVIPAPDAWLREVRRITQERSVPLIVDEVQTGLGRTGKLFAFEHAGITPDVVVLSKAIGGGLPLSVVVYHSDLDRWAPGAHAGTFRGNQLAIVAGTATMNFIRREGLAAHAERVGLRLLEHLQRIRASARCMGEVRGRGLMLGAEIVDADGPADDNGSLPAAPHLARRIQSEALERGLIVELGGRHDCVVRFLPPLIVTEEQVDTIATIFEDAIVAAERGAR
jgi:diaminobutyrate-2-oxoglutarate transaminase